MDVKELILTRRTIHNFLPDKVDDGLVQTALELSLWAPNHKLSFPWIYVDVGTQTREKLADLAVQLKTVDGPALSEAKVQATRENVLNPSHVIGVGIRRSPEPLRQHEDYAALAGGLQNAALYLWSLGVASKWSTGGWTKHTRTYEILGLDPQEVVLEGCLLIGQARVVPAVPERPTLAKHLRQTP